MTNNYKDAMMLMECGRKATNKIHRNGFPRMKKKQERLIDVELEIGK